MPSLKACRLGSRVMWQWELFQKCRGPAQLRDAGRSVITNASEDGRDATAETQSRGMAQRSGIFHHPLAFSLPPRPPQDRQAAGDIPLVTRNGCEIPPRNASWWGSSSVSDVSCWSGAVASSRGWPELSASSARRWRNCPSYVLGLLPTRHVISPARASSLVPSRWKAVRHMPGAVDWRIQAAQDSRFSMLVLPGHPLALSSHPAGTVPRVQPPGHTRCKCTTALDDSDTDIQWIPKKVAGHGARSVL